MNRIYNNPDYMVEDMTKGFLKANKDLIAETENPQVVKYKKTPVPNKVGIVTGGGSGHKPAFIGYVGENLCDAAAIGQIFSSPTAKAFLDAIKAADCGKGVACLYGNYAGDNMNVKMAVKKAKKAGIEVKTVVANDDCASAPKLSLLPRKRSITLVPSVSEQLLVPSLLSDIQISRLKMEPWKLESDITENLVSK